MPKKYPTYLTSVGQRVPSVTTILGVIDKGPGLRNWWAKNGLKAQDILNQAGEYGDKVHSIIEAYCQGQTVHPHKTLAPILENFIVKEKQFVKEWLWHEKSLISESHGYGGTADGAFISHEGKRVLLDIKTSNGLYPEYTLQLCAYRQALREMGEEFDEVMIWHLDKDTLTWNDVYIDTETPKNKITPLAVFQAALLIYRYNSNF